MQPQGKPLKEVQVRETLTCAQLAEYWDVTHQLVRHAAWEGKIPGATKTPGGHWRFDKETVLREWAPSRVQSWVHKNLKPTLDKGSKALQQVAGNRLEAMDAAVSPKDWSDIVQKAVTQALTGDRHARAWLGNYLMGMPIQRVAAKVDITDNVLSQTERVEAVMALLREVQNRDVEVIDGSAETLSPTDAI